jgi:hypothetical protein
MLLDISKYPVIGTCARVEDLIYIDSLEAARLPSDGDVWSRTESIRYYEVQTNTAQCIISK